MVKRDRDVLGLLQFVTLHPASGAEQLHVLTNCILDASDDTSDDPKQEQLDVSKALATSLSPLTNTAADVSVIQAVQPQKSLHLKHDSTRNRKLKRYAKCVARVAPRSVVERYRSRRKHADQIAPNRTLSAPAPQGFFNSHKCRRNRLGLSRDRRMRGRGKSASWREMLADPNFVERLQQAGRRLYGHKAGGSKVSEWCKTDLKSGKSPLPSTDQSQQLTDASSAAKTKPEVVVTTLNSSEVTTNVENCSSDSTQTCQPPVSKRPASTPLLPLKDSTFSPVDRHRPRSCTPCESAALVTSVANDSPLPLTTALTPNSTASTPSSVPIAVSAFTETIKSESCAIPGVTSSVVEGEFKAHSIGISTSSDALVHATAKSESDHVTTCTRAHPNTVTSHLSQDAPAAVNLSVPDLSIKVEDMKDETVLAEVSTDVKKEENLFVSPTPSTSSTSRAKVGESFVGGVAIALTHGSVLFQVAKREMHAHSAPASTHADAPTIRLEFHQQKGLNLPKHGHAEYLQLDEIRRVKREESAAEKRSKRKSNDEPPSASTDAAVIDTLPPSLSVPVYRDMHLVPTVRLSTSTVTSQPKNSWLKPQTAVFGPYQRW